VFSSLDEQLERVRRWNHPRRWGFTKKDFDAVDVTEVEHRHPLVRDVVAVYLPGSSRMDGVRRTCHELWSLVARDHPTSYAWDDGKSWTKPVRLLDSIQHRPGVRRVTLDLAAHWHRLRGMRPANVRGLDSAHAEVLAAAAHFPFWVRAMDGQEVPYVFLAGYEVTIPEYEAWRHVPCLSWFRPENRVSLTAHWADLSQTFWAAPVVVGRVTT